MNQVVIEIPEPPEREKLPNRRLLERHKLAAGQDGQQSFFVDIGFTRDGRPLEVFISGPASGSELGALAQDAALLISLCLQHGLPAETMARTIARVPVRGQRELDVVNVAEPASMIGAVLDLLANLPSSRLL